MKIARMLGVTWQKVNRVLKEGRKGLLFIFLALVAVFSTFAYLKFFRNGGENQTGILSVSRTGPKTTPEKFYMQNSEGKYVPYLIGHQNDRKKVSLKYKNGIQAFNFEKKSMEVTITQTEEERSEEVVSVWATPVFEYLKNGQWTAYKVSNETALTSRESENTVNLEGKYSLNDANGTPSALATISVVLGFNGDSYVNKWTFALDDSTGDKTNRLRWEVRKAEDLDPNLLALDNSDFSDEVVTEEKGLTKNYIYYPKGKEGSILIDPSLSLTAASPTITVTSNQSPSWKAVWDSAKGGLIDEFYTPSTDTTNIVEDDTTNQREQNLFNIRLAVSAGSNDSVAASEGSAKLTLLEATDARIKIRAEGDLETDGGSTDNGDYLQDYTIYPDRIVASGWASWNNASAATVFEHGFNFEPATFTNNGTATDVYIGDNDTAMAALATGTTWRTATSVTYESPGPVAVMQRDSSSTDISVWATEVPFQTAQDDEYYWENGTSFDRFAWGGDSQSISQNETIGFGSVMKITDDNTSDGSQGRLYARDFWNSDDLSFTTGSHWDAVEEERGRVWDGERYPVFGDGFETNDTTHWSSETDTGGNLTTSTASKYTGSYGMQVNVGATVAYVTDTTPVTTVSNPGRIRVRFYLNPNSITMATNDQFNIFADNTTTANSTIFMRLNYNGTNYRVQNCLKNDAGTDSCSGYVNLTNNAFNLIETEYGLINSVGYRLMWVNGVENTPAASLDVGTRSVDTLYLGNVDDRDAGTSGNIYFDDFKWSYNPSYLGSASFDLQDGSYSLSASANKFTSDIDGGTYTRYKPGFKAKNWLQNTNSYLFSLEGTTQTEGTNYNASNKPVSSSFFNQDITWASTLDSSSAVTTPEIGSAGAVSGATFTAGRYGNAASFDGNDDYVSVPISSNIDLTNPSSGVIEFWMRPGWDSSTTTSTYKISGVYNGATSDWFQFAFCGSDICGAGEYGDLLFEAYDNSVRQTWLKIDTADYSWKSGDWIHVRLVWDDALSSDDLQVFLNGVEPTHSHASAGGLNMANLSFGSDWYAGNFTNGGTQAFSGLIDEYRIYSTDTSITKLADGGDVSSSNEYLNDNSSNFSLDFADDDTSNRAEYAFFGTDEKFAGLNVDLATKGSGSSLNIDWEYWNGTAWVSLESVSGFQDTTNHFTTNGYISWNLIPDDWSPYSVNGSTDLYYVRAHLEAGTYTTSPVENKIGTDILLMQYLGNIAADSQTLSLSQGARTVSEWRFDEGTGTTAGDSTQNLNNLTISGATWQVTTDKPASTKRSYNLRFDGTNDYASLTNDPDFDFGTDSFTVSGWFRHSSSISGTDTIFSRATGVNGVGYKVYMDSSGYICFGIDDTAGTFPSDSACSTSAQGSLADSRWHHFSAVKSGTSSLTLYVDANSVNTDSSIATGSLNGNATLYTGIDSDGTSNPWTGDLDDITVYSYARSADQIKADVPDPSSALFGSSPTDPLTSALVGYWKLDESSGDAADSSGNGTTLTDGTSSTYTGGKFGNGIDFESGSSDYVSAADNAVLSITGDLTISAWVRPESNTASTFYTIAAKHDAAVYSYWFGQVGDELSLYLNNDSTNHEDTTGINLSTGTWYHVVARYISQTAEIRFFVNGEQVASTTTGTNPTSISDNAARFAIGAWATAGTPVDFYDGIIDDVRVYNRALSSAEVAALYSFAPGPVGWWKLDENTGQAVNDSSGNSNSGTLGATSGASSDDPSWSTGKYGSATKFDGSDDHVTVTDTASLRPGNGSWTVSAWANPADTNQDMTIVSKSAGGGGGAGYEEYSIQICGATDCASSGQYLVGTFIEQSGITDRSCRTTADVADGNMHHYVAIMDKDQDTILLFVDGVQMATSCSPAGSWPTVDNTQSLIFGAYFDVSLQKFFDRNIDDVRIYNYARTGKQIVEDMNAGHPAGGSPIGSQAIYWKFDEQQGSTANNSGSDDTLDGTTSGTVWRLENSSSGGCKINGCINIDTATDDISGGDPTLFDGVSAMSVSFWLNPQTLTTDDAIVSKTLASNRTFAITTSSAASDEIRVYIASSATDVSNYFTTSNLDLATGTWYHLMVVYDGSAAAANRVRVYKNGTLVTGSVTGTIPASMTTTASQFRVGDTDDDTGAALLAYIDEVKIYTFALTQSEVLVDTNAGSSAALGGVLGVAGSTPHDSEGFGGDPPYLHYSFDENTGTTIYDRSGQNSGYDMGFNGIATWSTGKYGSGMTTSSDPAGDNGADLSGAGADSILDFGDGVDFTFMAWVYYETLDQFSSNGHIVGRSNCCGDPTWALEINSSDQVLFNILDDSASGNTSYAITADTAISTNRWYHVAGVFDDSSETGTKLYIDGVEVANTRSGTWAIGSFSGGSPPFYVGSDNYGDVGGKFDDVRVYNYARSAAQIAYDYNRGAPVAWYKFDECTGATVYNSAVNANGEAAGMNGTITIGAGGAEDTLGDCQTSSTAWGSGATGKFNSSLSLDGTDDYVSMGDVLDPLTADLSISAWIKTDASAGSANPMIVAKRNSGTGTNAGFQFFVYPTNSSISYMFGDGSAARLRVNATGPTVTDNQWHNVVVTFDRDGSGTLYVDGKPATAGSGSISSQQGSINTTDNLYIGRETASGGYFDDQIDDVRLYGYVLTAGQIQRLYNEGSAVRFGPQTGSP